MSASDTVTTDVPPEWLDEFEAAARRPLKVLAVYHLSRDPEGWKSRQ